MRRWLAILAIPGVIAANPAHATYSLDCSGKRDTPDVSVKIGVGPYAVSIATRGAMIDTEHDARWRMRSRPARGYLLDVLDRRGQLVATIRLADAGDPTGYVGTIVMRGRKYWLRCGYPG